MSIRDIVTLGSRYVKLGVAAVAILALGLSLYYFLYYKQKNKEGKLDLKKLLLYGTFCCYMIVVLGVTTLRGIGSWQDGKCMPLFYSYREAWNCFSVVLWRNIILNILMFVPFGFLFPCLSKKFQKFWTTYLAGFLFTLLIESVQLVFKLGIFECDDLLNNTLGTMIGYGCYKIVQFVFLKWKRQEAKILQAVFAQIPAIVTIFVFVLIFKTYEEKELGNLSCSAIYELEHVAVDTDLSLSPETNNVMVYQLHIASKEETKQLAESIFGNMGLEIDETRTILYDDTAIYYSTSNENTGTKSLWIDYLGSTFNYTDFDKFSEKESLESEMDTEVNEEEIRCALEELGISVPEEAEFQFDEENQVCQFITNGHVEDGKFYDGSVTCEYVVSEGFQDINYYMCAYEEYKEYEILSEQEAFQKLQDGLFQYGQMESYDIQVEQISLEYQIDSKGFYQPVYSFEGSVNEEEAVIIIPAIK